MLDAIAPSETRRCEVARVLYQNAGGFVVAQVTDEHRRRYVVTGVCEGARAGAQWEVTGRLGQHAKYGSQFQADAIIEQIPSGRAKLEQYLASGSLPGVGPATAKALVARFGEDVITVLDRDPGRLRELPGIGEKKAARIQAGWEKARATYRIMRFLHGIGLGPALAHRVHKTFGGGSGEAIIARLEANPYLLATVRGIGFPTADHCALAAGVAPNAVSRLQAGLQYGLVERARAGHTATLHADWIAATAKLLDVDGSCLGPAATDMITVGREVVTRRIDSGDVVSTFGLARAEKALAANLATRARHAPGPRQTRALATVPRAHLSPSQKSALDAIARHALCIVTGGPGVGKTTLLKTVVAACEAAGLAVILCAPTGRAARRMTQTTGHEAATIHRTLGVGHDGRFSHTADDPIAADLVVIDEASMIDTLLAAALFAAIPPHAGVLIVGDADQLPSVGPGQVLADCVASGRIPVARLTEVFRQTTGSGITAAAHAILAGRVPEANADVLFVPMPEDDTALITMWVRDCVQAGFAPTDIQVLSPMKRGPVGTQALNAALRDEWNPASPDKAEIRTLLGLWRVGDRVMQTRNNYRHEISNGDIGQITRIGRNDEDTEAITVAWERHETVLERDDLDDITLAYAITTHKSQGAEYPAVIAPVTTGHYPLLSAPVLYTAITRARERVILVGTKRALSIAVRQNRHRRQTGLIAALQEAGRCV